MRSREELGIALVGPPRPDQSWQARVEGALTAERFEIDWAHKWARCPRGRWSSGWSERAEGTGRPYVRILFRQADCGPCPAGRDRGDPLAGRARLRAAPQLLSWLGQDSPAARGDRRRHQPRPPRELVPVGPACRHPPLALRRPRRLTPIRQQYHSMVCWTSHVWVVPLRGFDLTYGNKISQILGACSNTASADLVLSLNDYSINWTY